MKSIPISAAEKVAKDYGYDQVVIVGRKVSDNGGEHVTTYGVDKVHCAVAARVGHFLRHKIMGWPQDDASLQRALKEIDTARERVAEAQNKGATGERLTIVQADYGDVLRRNWPIVHPFLGPLV